MLVITITKLRLSRFFQIETVLMVGNKYTEYMAVTSAPCHVSSSQQKPRLSNRRCIIHGCYGWCRN